MSTSSTDPGLDPALSELEHQAIDALRPLRDAGTDRPLLELGWISAVRVQGSRAIIRLALPNFAAG
ncbi:MAG: hypothetical protein ACKOOC_08360, partial [Cyanobium sp.]